MANPIDLVITQDALKAIDAAIIKVDALDKELAKTAQNFIDNSKKMANAMTSITPSNVNNKSGDNAKLLADIDALKAKYVSLNDTVQKKLEQTRLAEIRLQQQREKAFDTFEKNAKKEEATLKKQETAYQRIQNSVNLLTKTYQDLAIRKELGGTLTVKEEKQLQSLTTRINTYQTALKNTDAIIQKNGRNVGNYASGYNALGNSINQLTREAPAFANSINTGFMALSNNFPALFDAIKGIREQNALLISQGKPTTSLFKQLVSGIFSWQTALSLGVTLLTLYGGKIVEYISGNKKAADSVELLANAQKEAAEGSVKEISHLETLRAKVTSVNAPMSERLKIVKELQDQYPSYFGNMTTEQILADKTSGAYEQLTKDILASARARAISAEIEKIAVKQLELETEIALNKSGKRNLKNALNLNLLQQIQDAATGGGNATLKKIIADQEKDLQELNKAQQALIEKYVLIDTGKLGEDGKDAADKKVKVKKERREDIEGLESHLKSVGFLKERIDAEISKLTTERITGSVGALPDVIFQIEQLIKLRKQLDDLPEADIKIVNTIKKTTAAVKELSEETKQFLKSFVDEFASNSGFSSLLSSFDLDNPESLFSKIKEGIEFTKEEWQASTVAIAEAGQEMYNFITNASQANFEAEKERLQSQYDIALTYAGENKAAQEKLAEDLEKKKKEIDQREAKAKKEQAIFNIAIDTAQAIVASLPNLVLAGIVAALGAVQIAAVASQKIPQFWMGGTHGGGLMMVNDGGGSNYKETVVTPDGKIMKPQGKNVIMNAPAGTEIYTHSMWQDKLAEMLQGKGIDMAPVINNNSGLSKSDMYDVMMDAFGSQPQHVSNFDAQGATEYITRNGNKTILNRNRSNGKGQRFR